MSEKYYYENPKVSDTIIFDIYTPDVNCCFNSDPFEIVNLKIYFIERNFSTDFFTQITANTGSPILEKNYLEASQLVCQDPENKDYQNLLKETKRKLLDSANISDLQFDNLIAVAVFGSEENPVWELSNPSVSILTKVYDINSNIVNGHFQFKFKQDGLRDGDYFLVWNWRPNISLQKLSASQFFSLSPETYKYIVPANFITDKNKYPDLLNLYMPEIYKTKLSNLDVSPEVLSKLNLAVGDAFANVENLANNLSSLIDYNLIPEYFLAYMGNFYRLNLYTNDPIRWRRQIAKAVPNFKMKGTINGLKSALSDAGINLISLTQLYQVYSKYTWTDVFYISSPQSEFELSKKSLPINSENFAVYKRTGSSDFVLQPLSYIKIDTYDFVSILTWTGPQLNSGDTIKILYQIETISDPVIQSLELYLRGLPLADTRDDLTFAYPPKNWNARVIAPNDPFFNEIIPQKNPFHELVVFGQIRTDFAYSENIYDMDEYNGSLRDSNNPCDIDKNFIDPCSGFITTLFNCDLTIEDLSPDRINEALQIINEYKPFHAVLHSLNYSGILNDYLAPAEETIEILISYYGTENMLANYPQTFFNRDMFEGLYSKKVVRTALATQINLGTDTVIGFNDAIVLYSPLVNFTEIGLNPTANTYLEILSPSPNQGNYTVLNPNRNYIEIYEQALITQPINQSQFAYRLSNINYSGTNIAVTQQNVYVFSDPILKDAISEYPIETEENSANPWKIKYYTTYPSYNIYIISAINPDGSIVLKNDITLPALTQGIYINNIQYELLNATNDSIYTSVDGSLFCYNNGLVTVNDGNFGDAKERLKVGDWFFYVPNSEQYQITEFGCVANTFRICSWNNGNVTGQSGKILDRIVEDTVGNLSYNGMIIEKPASLPAIEDPNDPNAVENNQFKENFILIINDNLYKIEDTYTEMSQDYLVLGGLRMDLTTQLAGGTSLSVESIQLKKTQQTINDVTVCYIDRTGAQEITAINQDDVPESLCELSPFAFNASLLTSLENKGENSHINDIIKQEEKIGFKIETVDGQTYEGNLS